VRAISDPIRVIMKIVFSDKIKNLSNTVLLLLMLMAVYSHYMVNDKFERIAPALVSDRLQHDRWNWRLESLSER